MTRIDWLLLFLSRRPFGRPENEDGGLDPIRIQKGMFLLSKRGPARDLYDFRPYNWGPFSRDIYDDLDGLVGQGLVEARPVPGQTWHFYSTTEEGEQYAQRFAAGLEKGEVDWLAKARTYVSSRSFSRLLREIYTAYPDYTRNSQFEW